MSSRKVVVLIFGIDVLVFAIAAAWALAAASNHWSQPLSACWAWLPSSS